MWEDYILSAGGFILAITLLPAIGDKQKPPLSTSIPACLVLISFAVAYFSLALYIAAAVTLFTAACWLTLAIQRLRQNKVIIVDKAKNDSLS